MKRIPFFFLFFAGLLHCFLLEAQTLPPVDKSPLDISYYPYNYPVLKIQNKISDPLLARVIYSRPRKEGRQLFGGLIEYGKLWRLGANEATEIEFFKPVRISGKRIGKGRYTLYAIAQEKTWTIIINKETDTWGHFKYDPKKDLLRVELPVQKSTEMTEAFTMAFEKSATGINLIIAWDNVRVAMPIVH